MKFNYLCTAAIEVSTECLKDTNLNKRGDGVYE